VNYPIHATLHEEDCELFVRIGCQLPSLAVALLTWVRLVTTHQHGGDLGEGEW